MAGLQLLRSLLSGLSVYLGQVQDVSPGLLAILIFAIFVSAFAAPLVRRCLGAQRAFLILAAVLALLRVAEQFCGNLDAQLAIAVAGVVVWLWFIPFAVSAGAAALMLVVGLAVDTAIKGSFSTIDLAFAPGLVPDLTAVALSIASLTMILWLAKQEPRIGSGDTLPMLSLALGPVIALQLLILQNLAHHAALIGWSLPAVFAWTTLANVAAIVVVLELRSRGERPGIWLKLAAGAVLIVSVLPDQPAWLAAATALLSPIAAGILLSAALAGRSEHRVGWFGASLGLMAIPIVLFGWYAHYEIAVPFPQWLIPLLAAVLAATVVVRPTTGQAAEPLRRSRVAVAAACLLLILPLHLYLTWNSPEPGVARDELRVATYNIHQGFDLSGRHDLEGIAQVIEAAQPQVVALQEVSRGWLMNGSVDTLSWLAQRLRMHVAWGPAADPNWGNAILSRYPIVEVENRPMPNNDDLLFDRAFLIVMVQFGDERVQVVATHLHHIEREPQHRLPQARALLESVDWNRPTVLLGDLNAQPHHAELRLLLTAGLSTVQPLVPTYPADRPRRQIDYILATAHFEMTEVEAPRTTASDHLPLLATLIRRNSEP